MLKFGLELKKLCYSCLEEDYTTVVETSAIMLKFGLEWKKLCYSCLEEDYNTVVETSAIKELLQFGMELKKLRDEDEV